MSLSLIRKLEQGERADTRIETARQLAVALRIPTSGLITRHGVEAADAATTDHWAAVRGALVAPVRPALDEPPSIGGMNAAIAAAIPLRKQPAWPADPVFTCRGSGVPVGLRR